MEVVVDIILTGAILGWIIQLALLKKKWIRCLVPVLMGVVLFILRPIALQQNNGLLKKILTESPTNEVFLTILWGGIIIQLIVNGKIIQSQLEYKNLNRFWQFWQRIFFICPGIIVLSSLFYVEINFFLLDWTVDFVWLAIAFCVGVAIVPLLLAILFRFLLNPLKLRELHFFSLLLQLIATMALSAIIINKN